MTHEQTLAPTTKHRYNRGGRYADSPDQGSRPGFGRLEDWMEKPSALANVWRFVWPVLVIAAAAAVLAGASFLIWGKLDAFDLRTYSDRLFWAGIVLIMLGGFAIVAALGSLYTVGTPSVLTAGADARNAQSRIQDHFRMNSKRYSFVFRMLTSGLLCIAISALLEIATR
jgi:hypothetical protein